MTSLKAQATRLIPEGRRIRGMGGANGRFWLQVRKLGSPLLRFPVVLTGADGVRLELSSDPVDEQVANDLLGPRRTLYFPSWRGDPIERPVILDIGAHHGFYAVCALAEHPGSTLIAVEPSADAVPLVKRNLELNGVATRARLVNAGLASEPGKALLRHTDEGSWGSSLFDEESATLIQVEEVDVLGLEEILDGQHPDIIKCNAEGAEYALIDQLERLALQPQLMVLMVHPEYGDAAALLGRVEGLGYELAQHGTATRPVYHCWKQQL